MKETNYQRKKKIKKNLKRTNRQRYEDAKNDFYQAIEDYKKQNNLSISIYRDIPVELNFWQKLRVLLGAKANVVIEIDTKTAEPTNRGTYIE